MLQQLLLISLLHAHSEGCKKGCTGCNYQLVIFLRASSALYLAGTPSASISFSFLCRTAYICNHAVSPSDAFLHPFIHLSIHQHFHPAIHLAIQSRVRRLNTCLCPDLGAYSHAFSGHEHLSIG